MAKLTSHYIDSTVVKVLMAQKVNRTKELQEHDKIVSSMTTRRLTRKNVLNAHDRADDSCMPQITVIIMDLKTRKVDYSKHFSKLDIYNAVWPREEEEGDDEAYKRAKVLNMAAVRSNRVQCKVVLAGNVSVE